MLKKDSLNIQSEVLSRNAVKKITAQDMRSRRFTIAINDEASVHKTFTTKQCILKINIKNRSLS